MGSRALATGASGGTPDFLSIVEAAYTLDGSNQAWTGRLLEAADRAIGLGLGGFACIFAANPDGTITIDRSSAALVRQSPVTVEAIFDGLTHAPPGCLSAYLKGGGGIARCLMTSEVDAQGKLSYRDRLAGSGVPEAVNLACMDLDQRGVLLSLGAPEDATIPGATRADLVRVASHILAALRLRTRLAAQPSGAQTPLGLHEPRGAVLLPDGEVVRADGEAALAKARHALQNAVRDVTLARTALRADGHGALGLWRGLVLAQWTLVDRFESDGARYVVAKENAPRARGLAELTSTERCVVTYAARGSSTKEIAYLLGISVATVRVLLMRAARRCGVRGREALLALGRGVGHQAK